MRNLFTKLSLGVLMGTAGCFAADAQGTIEGLTFEPSNGTVMGGMGYVYINFPNDVKFDVEGLEEGTDTNHVPLQYESQYTDKVHITINGKPAEDVEVFGMGFSWADSDLWLKWTVESNEQFGGTDTWGFYQVQFYYMMSFFWKGEIKFNFDKGFLTDTTGKETPAFELVYYCYDLYDNEAQASSYITSDLGDGQLKYGDAKINYTFSGATTVKYHEGESENSKIRLRYINDEEDSKSDTFIYLTENEVSSKGNVLILDLSTLPYGEYEEVLMPEGCVFIEQGGTTYINAEYTGEKFEILKPEPEFANVSITPEPGEVKALENVVISWGENPFTLNSKNITVTYNGEIVDNVEITVGWNSEEDVEGYDGNQLTVGLSAIDLGAGEYVVTVPAGYATIRDNTGLYTEENSEVIAKYNYIIKNLGTPEVSPAEGEVEYLSSVTFTFAEGMQLSAMINSDEIVSVTFNEEPLSDFNVKIAENVVEVSFAENLTEPGSYVVTIPMGYLTGKDGEGFKVSNTDIDYTATYTIPTPPPGMLEAPKVITPEEGEVETLTTVTISWNLDLTLNEECTEKVALIDESTNSQMYSEVDIKEGMELVISLDELEDGDYTLIVPAEYVIAQDEAGKKYFNQEIELAYTVKTVTSEPDQPEDPSAIGSIHNDIDNGAVIFNLQGQKINGKNLRRGIYIVNGQKVVVK